MLRLSMGPPPALGDAVIGMKVGGKRTAVIPGDMTVGTVIGGVPPLKPYVVDIELLSIN